MLNRVKVIICGREYMLQTEEAPSYVYNLAKLLERQISDIIEKSPRASIHSASVMVALSTMDELSKMTANVESIRAQVKEYVDQAGKARIDLDSVMMENESLKARLAQVEAELKQYQPKESANA